MNKNSRPWGKTWLSLYINIKKQHKYRECEVMFYNSVSNVVINLGEMDNDSGIDGDKSSASEGEVLYVIVILENSD
jgi:hypothetical protein